MKKREIDCLDRLFSLGAFLDEMADWFVTEGLMDRSSIPNLKNTSDKAKFLEGIIEKARENGNLQLADFEWQILPYERIRIYFVTKKMDREFLYNNA